MGGPKARLLVRGEPLVLTHIMRLREAGAVAVVAVVAPRDERLVAGAARVALSCEPDQAGSLSRGIDRLAGGDDIVLVSPVDAIPASVPTLRELVRAVADGAAAAVPTYEGRRGHPVAVRASVLRAGQGRPLRDVLAALGDARAAIAVTDPAVVTDLDEPADFERVVGEPVRFREA
jgi:molybdenum cofactor cytidylyltransferase